MSAPSPDAFQLGDPSWFLDGLDMAAGRARFVRADREALSAEPFLDYRWRRDGAASLDVPLPDLGAIASEPAPLSFIWHTSYAASTLLAACLDSHGQCLALREPQALTLLAALKRREGLRNPALARTVFALLARRFRPGELVLIKPANSANALIAEAAALTEGRSLLLYSDCESFLISLAREGAAGFGYARELFMILATDGHPAGRWPPEHLFRLTDLQLAVLVWRMQMDVLQAASARLGDRARSLDCRRFLDDPAAVLGAVDDFLELGLGRARIQRTLEGPLFGRDAKRPGQAFDPKARAGERQRLRAQLGSDLDAALASIDQAFPHPPRLAPPLELHPRPATASPGPLLETSH